MAYVGLESVTRKLHHNLQSGKYLDLSQIWTEIFSRRADGALDGAKYTQLKVRIL